MNLLLILVLAIVQGLAELLPVSSSAHVTIAAKLMGYDTSNVYEWTFLLVMLHTGTMFSVLIYFWSRWKGLLNQIPSLIIATLVTGAVGYPLMLVLKKLLLQGQPGTQPQEIEHLFLNLPLMAGSLAVVGMLIIWAGMKDEKISGVSATVRRPPGAFGVAPIPQQSAIQSTPETVNQEISNLHGAVIGAVQGLALPFRGFSRSGSTISAGILLGIRRMRAEEFSFALAVILTPAIIGREVWMLIKEHGGTQAAAAGDAIASGASSAGSVHLSTLLLPGLIGMVASFVAGMVALKWLSSWLEHGRWKFFGFYCLLAAAGVLAVHLSGI